VTTLRCVHCGEEFEPRSHNQVYCPRRCRGEQQLSAVYRFVCPDGRSYVGSRIDCRGKEETGGVDRLNSRLSEALKLYPRDTWRFEIIEILDRSLSYRERRAREQFHIDRLGSGDPRRGFNVMRADTGEQIRIPYFEIMARLRRDRERWERQQLEAKEKAERIYLWEDALSYVGVEGASLLRGIRRGRIPAPAVLTADGRVVGWSESQIKEYHARLIAATERKEEKRT
jgi:predicted DNA-binding transcriptional regulator AlpA